MGLTTRMRFLNYEIRHDPTGSPLFAVQCVSDRDPDQEETPECGATSGELAEPQRAARWLARHAQETGHTRFQRQYAASSGARSQPS